MFSYSKLSILVISSLLASVVLGWSANAPNHQASSRRAFLDTAAKVVPLVALSAPAFAAEETAIPAAPAEPAPAEPEPVAVEEQAPAPVSDENDLIARLKKQSEANKEKYQQQAIRSDKLSSGQFSSQYDRPNSIPWTRP